MQFRLSSPADTKPNLLGAAHPLLSSINILLDNNKLINGAMEEPLWRTMGRNKVGDTGRAEDAYHFTRKAPPSVLTVLAVHRYQQVKVLYECVGCHGLILTTNRGSKVTRLIRLLTR